ncbi:ADAM 17-like protease isoform X2 [Dreissena polymorpha]|nr:ADAM 17-like protease isoform X2 [Dreissena polymorpha]
MIGYRREDIKSDNHPLCGAVHPEDEGYTQPDDVENKQFKHDGRTKRAIGNKICKIVAVADYRYYQQQGREVFKTANNIANIMSKVNQVYSQTQFRGGKGYGFEFSKLIIHTAASTTQSDQQTYPYNIPKTNWRTQELLDALSSASVHSGSCLTHLFTATAMSERVLGLAYIAKPGKTGGICSPRVSYNGVLKAFNTGWSTSLNGDGQTLTFLQQALVTAHEFGHNWGSEHDPSSGDCAPGTILDDGKYLMFAYSVTGEDSNNELFSSCSINYVNQVLATQSVCFTEATPYSPCGNGRLETSLGEQCDAGFLGSVDQDVCCTSNCKLRPNAQCSPSNQACCTSSCFLAPSTMTCRGEVEGTCKARQNCSGTSYDCPLSGNKADGTDCLDGGQCLFGECKTFCEYRNFNSCVCDTVETSCKRCCRDVNSGRCKVMDQALNVANGRSCIQGYCTAGVCIKVETDLIARLWNLIDQISFDFLVESFKTNMVACITGFSLILYFPICVVIWCYDRRRKNKWEKEFTAHIRTDRGLAHDENKRPIVRPGQPEAPAKLNASDLLDHSSYRRPNSRNQVQPVGNLPSWSKA